VTRLRRLRPDQLDPDQRALYDEIIGGARARGRLLPLTDADGGLHGPFNAMLYAPGVGDALQRLGAAVRFGTSLTERARELAILTVAAARDSGFERYAHEAIGRSVGLDDKVIAAVRAGAEVPVDDPVEQIVVRVARALAYDGDLDDDLYGQAVDRLGSTTLVELTALVGHYAAIALQLRVFRVEIPEQSRDAVRS